MPAMKPTASFARGELKNEPCPQSWKIMNTRTKKAPASTASGTTSHKETDRHTYISHHKKAYGTRVLMICQVARQVEDFWYLATISFHAATSAREPARVALAL